MRATNNIHRNTATPKTIASSCPTRATGVGNIAKTRRNLIPACCARLGSIENVSSNSNDDGNTNNRGLFRRGFRRLFNKGNFGEAEDEVEPETPIVSPIEPNLYMLPGSLHCYYRPLPKLARVLNLGLATSMAFVSTQWRMKQNTISPSLLFSFWFLRQTAIFVTKSVLWTLLAQIVLQDTLFGNKRPSRVSVKTLMQKFSLPSTISKYESITMTPIDNDGKSTAATKNDPFKLGVHYLQYNNEVTNDGSSVSTSAAAKTGERSFNAIYFQHGFGASSLSWLPVLPTLAKQMNARVALAHDTVGFGLTDRPKDRRWYLPRQSARISQEILARATAQTAATSDTSSSADKASCSDIPAATTAPICLVGHSMGSRSILRLATLLPLETPKLILLSSPALGLIPPQTSKPTSSSKLAHLASSLVAMVTSAVSERVFRPAAKYALRRAIGTRGSWKRGLQSAWGDPSKVSENSEVLRYSWPSIVQGWEDGILNFAGAQRLVTEDELDDDYVLMEKVLSMPNTKVLIVLGSKDKVIPKRSVEQFLAQVVESAQRNGKDVQANVPIVEMKDLGHCAFEEDREAFCGTVEQLLRDHWDNNRS